MKVVEVRQARATDVVRVARYALPPRFWGLVGEEDGEVIGTVLILWVEAGDQKRKRPFLTLDITDKLRRRHPTMLHRIGRSITRAGAAVFGGIYVMEDCREPTAKWWLARLGFEDTGERIAGARVLWKPSP